MALALLSTAGLFGVPAGIIKMKIRFMYGFSVIEYSGTVWGSSRYYEIKKKKATCMGLFGPNKVFAELFETNETVNIETAWHNYGY
jgi:hypothetical protein